MAIKKSELYSSLWESCNELRGGMDASEYKNYVLVLLFIKYVSDKYYGKENPLIVVPKGGSFQDMVALKGKPNIGDEIKKIKEEVKYATNVSQEIKLASRDNIDLKSYEPAMRHLIDTYISAEDSKKISEFENTGLLEIIINNPDNYKTILPKDLVKDKQALAKSVEINIKKSIQHKSQLNPEYYRSMSELLDDIIERREQNVLEYQEHLNEILELSKKIEDTTISSNLPKSINTPAKKSLYDNLNKDVELVNLLHNTILENTRDNWRGNIIKERALKAAISNLLPEDIEFESLFKIIKSQDEY